jgi:cell division protease FtsH
VSERSGTRDGARTTPPRDNGAPERPWRVEGSRDAPGPPPSGPLPWTSHRRRRIWVLLALLLAVNWLVALNLPGGAHRVTVPYSYFRTQAQAGNVTEVSSQAETIQGTFRKAVEYPNAKAAASTEFETVRPAFADDAVLSLLLRKHAVINAKPVQTGQSPLMTVLVGFVPTILLLGGFFWLMRRAAAGAASGISGLGRSKARRYDASAQRTSFADVAGIDEVTEEVGEVVDFLKHPERYRRLGGMIPTGVLLTGQPGTGKTLLARAVAGEADVPFFSLSASEFVEMIVGVGASRVRDLFEQAKRDAPAIIFVDELDAIGRARGAGGLGGANDEREQTLNQILTEMDGFTGTEGVIVLAATNRPEVLDPALLRPGRFDRRIAVNAPDQTGRLKILQVHTRSVPLEDGVDLAAVASSTPGMVGADLRNLVNEASLSAARAGRDAVARRDFTDALERIVLGAARRILLSPQERRRTAYHESGHALLGMLEPGADPVRKVSIIPRGHALGVTFQSPESDRYGYGEAYLRGRITGALGGRAAEQLVFGEATTGAESDLEQATAVARQMVGRWGMSEQVGLVSALPRHEDEPSVFAAAVAQHTLELIDQEVKRITSECYARALAALTDHREQLDALAATLLERETLDEADAYAAAGLPAPQRTDDHPIPLTH